MIFIAHRISMAMNVTDSISYKICREIDTIQYKCTEIIVNDRIPLNTCMENRLCFNTILLLMYAMRRFLIFFPITVSCQFHQHILETKNNI